jgi:hypothetical protein
MSPQRRKNNQPLVGESDSVLIHSSSPRNGNDSKRSRHDSQPQAITDHMGWGRCTLSELAQFSIGDQFIIIITADHKNDNKHSKKQRQAVRERIISSVATVLADNSSSSAGSTKAPYRRLSDAAMKKNAHDHLLSRHGIERNKMVYIELRCYIHRYPHRDDFINNIIPKNELEMLIRQNEGLYIGLLDYEHHIVHIRWNELPFIQIWQPYFRTDHRPAISIHSERGSPNYITDILRHFELFKDDSNRMCEILLVHEKKKTEHLSRIIRQLENENLRLLTDSHHVTNMYIANSLHSEMTDNRLPEVTTYVDKHYYDAFVVHYSDFQRNAPLMDRAILIEFNQMIERTFPIHYSVLKSIIFGKRSHEPARANKQYNLDKRYSILHFFFCLVRERDNHQLTHWAMVATIAFHYRGVNAVAYRNSLGRSYTTDLQVALDKLDDIFVSTEKSRMNILKQQRFLTNVLDNYNRFCRFSTQRCGKSGVFHNGIVHSAVRVNEFNKPPGTLLMNNLGETWRVMSSTLCSTFRECIVVAELLQKEEDDLEFTSTGIHRSIKLPSIEWIITFLPGQSSTVSITYLDQAIPSSISMKVPVDLTCQGFILGDNYLWMQSNDTRDVYRTLGVREYASMVKVARELQHLFASIIEPIMGEIIETIEHDDINVNKYTVFQKHATTVLSKDPSLRRRTDKFRVLSMSYFNKSYYCVGEYMLLPLIAKDEMQKDELYLAVLEIMEQLGFLDNSTVESTVLETTSRRVFQYGDVLTIQKLHQLNPGVLKMMTHIGKEMSGKKMYSLLTKTCLRNHDYLHENIHRLQAIFKVYYPGFIEVCCTVLGTKRVSIDPTKGRWRDHEHIVVKIVSALKELRYSIFVSQRNHQNVTDVVSPSDFIWQIMCEYREFCASLLQSSNDNIRYVCNFFEIVDKWDNCRESVRVGDWATLEVEAIDWMTVWGQLKKPLYQMETMRRVEINYRMTAEEMEYHRNNRFFRMHPNGNCMSYDDFCEKHNYAMKQCSNHADIDKMCNKSRHLHVASRCANMVFGYEGKKPSFDPRVNDDVRVLIRFFAECNVFAHVKKECPLDRSCYATNCYSESFESSDDRYKIDKQSTRALTEMEKRALMSLKSPQEFCMLDPEDDEWEEDDDMNYVETIAEGDMVCADELDDVSLESTSIAGEDEEGDNRVIVGHCLLNKKGCEDLFAYGDAFHSAVKKRITQVKAEEEYRSTIEKSVDYFNSKIKQKMMLLQRRREDRCAGVVRDMLPHEQEVRLSRINYMSSMNNSR